MQLFKQSELEAAIAHAAEGGQALHLHRIIPDPETAPSCFVRAVDRGEFIAHLFDADAKRLIKTALSLGVKAVVVDRKGTDHQHIDLCGIPLKRARAMAQFELLTAPEIAPELVQGGGS